MKFLGYSIWVGLVCLALIGCQGQEGKAKNAPKGVFTELGKKDVKVGDGATVEEGDLVLVEYQGRLQTTGAEFDSNTANPATDKPLAFRAGKGGGVIEGMGMGVVGMKPGGEREIEVPWSLGYAEAGSPPKIPAFADLIFQVKLLWVVKEADKDATEFEDVRVGTGAQANKGSVVEVHYVGRYVNGREFDSSRKRGKTVTFEVGSDEAISGIDRGVVGMKVGGRRKLWLPPNTGWGEFGSDIVPGNQVLIYEVDLVSVRPANP